MKSISYLLGCMLLILCWACDKDSIEEQSPVLKTKAESIQEGLTITDITTTASDNRLGLDVRWSVTEEFSKTYSFVEFGYSVRESVDMRPLRTVAIGEGSGYFSCFFTSGELPHGSDLWIGARGVSQLENSERPGYYLPSRTEPNYTTSRLVSHWATKSTHLGSVDEGGITVPYIEVTVYFHFTNKKSGDYTIHEGTAWAFIGQGSLTESDADVQITASGRTGDVVAVTQVIPMRGTTLYVYSGDLKQVPPVSAATNIYARVDVIAYI